MNVYSVLWADDECDTLRKEKVVKMALDSYKIEVLAWARTSQELKDKLELLYDKVDAVIVDGNFSKEDMPYLEKDDISGLIHTLSFIATFNIKRDIPFYLYTGRETFLQEKCLNKELDYFQSNRRIFQKGNVGGLFSTITKDVDHIKSIEFMVKKQYAQLLNMASKVSPSCKEKLLDFLLNEARDSKFDKAEDMFTSLRQILEIIQEKCTADDICPKYESLNDFGRFWGSRDNRDGHCKGSRDKNGINYIPATVDIMPPPIAYTFMNLIKITQDGSHFKSGLSLNVNKYVQDTQNPFIFRSCLYQVMDVIRWYNDLFYKLQEGILQPPTYKVMP